MTLRVPEELKRKMESFSLNWSEELRSYIQRKIKMFELQALLQELKKARDKMKPLSDSTPLIREDRDMR